LVIGLSGSSGKAPRSHVEEGFLLQVIDVVEEKAKAVKNI
jgi:hypothetical protein